MSNAPTTPPASSSGTAAAATSPSSPPTGPPPARQPPPRRSPSAFSARKVRRCGPPAATLRPPSLSMPQTAPRRPARSEGPAGKRGARMALVAIPRRCARPVDAPPGHRAGNRPRRAPPHQPSTGGIPPRRNPFFPRPFDPRRPFFAPPSATAPPRPRRAGRCPVVNRFPARHAVIPPFRCAIRDRTPAPRPAGVVFKEAGEHEHGPPRFLGQPGRHVPVSSPLPHPCRRLVFECVARPEPPVRFGLRRARARGQPSRRAPRAQRHRVGPWLIAVLRQPFPAGPRCPALSAARPAPQNGGCCRNPARNFGPEIVFGKIVRRVAARRFRPALSGFPDPARFEEVVQFPDRPAPGAARDPDAPRKVRQLPKKPEKRRFGNREVFGGLAAVQQGHSSILHNVCRAQLITRTSALQAWFLRKNRHKTRSVSFNSPIRFQGVSNRFITSAFAILQQIATPKFQFAPAQTF